MTVLVTGSQTIFFLTFSPLFFVFFLMIFDFSTSTVYWPGATEAASTVQSPLPPDLAWPTLGPFWPLTVTLRSETHFAFSDPTLPEKDELA